MGKNFYKGLQLLNDAFRWSFDIEEWKKGTYSKFYCLIEGYTVSRKYPKQTETIEKLHHRRQNMRTPYYYTRLEKMGDLQDSTKWR